MILPNFLIIGANKAGTSSLYRYLRQHPDIYMGLIKEPMFFIHENKYVDKSRPDLEQTITTLEEYQALFQEVSTEKAVGEASTAYLPSLQAPERIKRYIPNVKLIAILRDPAERAYSNYLMHLKWNLETIPDFSEALQKVKEDRNIYPKGWRYTSLGFYYEQLKRYFDTFNPTQVRIYLYEDDWCKNPNGLIKNIFQFLEVDDCFIPDMSNRYNENSRKPILAQNTRKELIEIYREDILKLQDMLQRDLSEWLK